MLLRWRKKAADHRNMRHSLRNSPPDCFCQMLRIWSLVSQVQILQINKKRKQAILKNGLLPFGRGDKIIGVKFGLAAGFLPFCTATVLQRRYCCKNCSIACLIICACAMPSAAHFSRKAAAISLGTRTEIVSYTFWLYLAFTCVDVLVFLFASLMTQPPYFTDHIAQDHKCTATNGYPQRNTHSGTDRHHQKHTQNGHPKTILFHLKNSFLYDIMNMPPPQGGGAFAPLWRLPPFDCCYQSCNRSDCFDNKFCDFKCGRLFVWLHILTPFH